MEEGLTGEVGAEVARDTIWASTRVLIRDLVDVAVASVVTSEVVLAVMDMEVAVADVEVMPRTGATTTTAMGTMPLDVDVALTEEGMLAAGVVGLLAGSASIRRPRLQTIPS